MNQEYHYEEAPPVESKQMQYPYPFNVIVDILEHGNGVGISEAALQIMSNSPAIPHLFEYFLYIFLNDRERKVIHLYYREQLSLNNIGTQLDVTGNRIFTIKNYAIAKLSHSELPYILRNSFYSFMQGIKDEAYDRDRKAGYEVGYKRGYDDGHNDLERERLFAHRQRFRTIKSIDDLPHIELKDLNLPARAYSCLKRADLRTLREIACLEPEDLMHIRNFGKISYMNVVDMLEKYGIDTTCYIEYFEGKKRKAE